MASKSQFSRQRPGILQTTNDKLDQLTNYLTFVRRLASVM